MPIIEIERRRPRIASSAFVAPTAIVAGDVRVDERASIWFGCVIRAERSEVLIGGETNIQDLTVIHCDPGYPVHIGKRVTVGHRAVLHGCKVDDDALIGMGAILLNGCSVGRGAIVGAGAVVTEGMEVPPTSLALGIPARVYPTGVQDLPRPNVSAYMRLTELYRKVLDDTPCDGQ